MKGTLLPFQLLWPPAIARVTLLVWHPRLIGYFPTGKELRHPEMAMVHQSGAALVVPNSQQSVHGFFHHQQMCRFLDDAIQAGLVFGRLFRKHDYRRRARAEFYDVCQLDASHSRHKVFRYNDIMHFGIEKNKSLLRISRHIHRETKVGQKPFSGNAMPFLVIHQKDGLHIPQRGVCLMTLRSKCIHQQFMTRTVADGAARTHLHTAVASRTVHEYPPRLPLLPLAELLANKTHLASTFGLCRH